MSHFTVMVRVPFDTQADIKAAVRAMLIPYKESGCSEDDPPELRKHLEFEDIEDEYAEKYAAGSCSMIRLADGKMFSAYDNRFKKPFDFNRMGGSEYEHPPGSEKVETPLRERYVTFEEYMADYCGYTERDSKAKRYGSWRNPNQKWDWYQIGGRWTGYLPLKSGAAGASGEPGLMTKANADRTKADICRISDVDFDRVAIDSRVAAEEFWTEWQRFCDGAEFPAFDGPRNKALSLGLLSCKDADELTGSEWKAVKWSRQIKPGVDRFDVLVDIAREDFFAKYTNAFCSVKTWAYLDATGWSEPGKIGWWACSSEFDESAYMPLYEAGGMALSNAFSDLEDYRAGRVPEPAVVPGSLPDGPDL